MKSATCRACHIPFTIREEDRAFYERMHVPIPTLCPDCRQKRRLTFRNERTLYKRTCDLTKEKFVSLYAPESTYKVYAPAAWWSDKWDALTYGKPFDFSQTFFAQFASLLKKVPHLGITISHGENSDYCPHSVYYKDSYMCVSGIIGRNCYYTYWSHQSTDCMDCACLFQCERCYECIDCSTVSFSAFCKECKNSHNLVLCQDMVGCDHCIACIGLTHKSYHILNKPVTKAEFEAAVRKIQKNPQEFQKINAQFEALRHMCPQRNLYLINVENSIGDHLSNCKNTYMCFDGKDLEDCAYLWSCPKAKNAYDANYCTGELFCEALSCVNMYNGLANWICWDCSDTSYSMMCFYSNHLFGCVGLKNKSYCILNQQYTKEEYNSLMQQIIAHMRKTEEWGAFFPAALSPFAYNETVAQEYFPLTATQAQREGYAWKDADPKEYKPQTYKVPPRIQEVPDTITQEILACHGCGRNYKVIPQELRLYRNMMIPIPQKCPHCRHKDRMMLRNPRRLWQQPCAQCGNMMHTSYAPERKEIIYCEECYRQLVI